MKSSTFGKRLIEVRKAKKLSQDDVAKKLELHGAVIGRYERDEVKPSIEMAAAIADALEVSLDYLTEASDKVSLDKRTLKLIDDIEELDPAVKDKLYFLANAIIRDAKTGKAYS